MFPIHLRPFAAGSLLLAAVAIVPSPARAEPNAQQLQAARDLFTQAEQDEDAERWQAALDKLRRIAAVKLTAGVRYHIALCEEHAGRLASALTDYAAAENQAVRENAHDVLRLVSVEMASLVSRVPRLAIHLVPDLPTATVTLDGAVVTPEHLGATVTVDPGVHQVEAIAPGRPVTRVDVTMGEREVTFLDVVLQPLAAASGRSGAAGRGSDRTAFSLAPERHSRARARTAPIAFTALAVALAGAGVGAYLAADNSHANAVRSCGTVTGAADDACDSLKSPVRAWDWAAAGAWTGAAVTAAIAAYLWSRPPGDSGTRALGHVVLGPGSVGAIGSF